MPASRFLRSIPMRPNNTFRLVSLLPLVLALVGCGSTADQPADSPAAMPPAIVLATTTSARDSGLVDVLLPRFQAETGLAVDYVAVGTGQALAIGRRGDADLLLTHARQAEEEFLAAGFAESRTEVFWNDFVVVGPKSDPAAVSNSADALDALRRIAASEARFVSRGDDSGTHKLEQQLWQELQLQLSGDWYISVGEGMAHTLRVAYELQGYTLVDRGTWLAQRARSDLTILHAGDPRLVNQYAVLVIDPQKHPHRQTAAARQLAEFLETPDTQKFIAEFGREQFGEPLFHPGSAALK
jgi:tungstate transport system substrate-binding protein